MSDIAIKVDNLSKVYKLYDKNTDRMKEALHPMRKKYHKDFYALNNVSFEIMKGETVGIIGSNGSGKSTLLKVITGVLCPSSGNVVINGKVSALLELGSGFNPEFTGLENVYFNGSIMGYTRDEMNAKIDEILSFADIGDFVYQPVKSYSSGMFVRLAFAVAASVDPDILIVDEALAVGDIRFQYKCHRKFKEFREAGKTFLFVSHSSSDIVRLCDRTIWLNSGNMRKDGISKFVTEEYIAWMAHDSEVFNPVEKQKKSVNNSLDNEDLVLIPQNAEISGECGAVIESIGFFSDEGKRISILKSSSKVKLIIKVFSKVQIDNPWVGFSVINGKGLRVFGSNSYGIDKKIEPISSNSVTMVCFEFMFPEIENGIYMISVAINDGTPDSHIRLYNIIDAYEFQFSSSSLLQKQTALLKLKDCEIHIS